MKYILHRGLLAGAVLVMLVLGCKNAQQAPATMPAPVTVPVAASALTAFRGGHQPNSTEFDLDLMEKGQKNPPHRELTDHPADYQGITTYKWTLDEEFTIYFYKNKTPCVVSTNDQTKIFSIEAVQTGPKTWTATCNVGSTVPASKKKHYLYNVYLNVTSTHSDTSIRPAKLSAPDGVPTCDGCFVEID